MNVERLKRSDVNLLLDLIPEGWEGVLPIIHWYTCVSFCHPFKIVKKQKIVGVGVAVLHQDTAWLSHIMVHPLYRKQGVGAAITQYLIDFVCEKGIKSIYLIATEMGAPVYSKLGFEVETEYCVFKGEKIKLEETLSDKIIPCRSEYKEQILLMDRLTSGEGRSAYFDEHLEQAQIFIKDEVIEGFYMPTLGDGLIIATTPLAGKELMKLRLATKDFFIFPQDNTIAAELMSEYNFKKMYKVKRMFLGERIKWNPEYLYNRVGGNIG